MPNYLGLLTKTEAKELRDLKLLTQSDKIIQIAEGIAMTQKFDALAVMSVYNTVVHDDVVKYFKNTMGYTVVENKVGQPAGFTLLISISWAL